MSPGLAASVGANMAELDAEPIDPLAVDVVFDALCESQSGIVARSECDERRAAFEDADGKFDAEAFAAGLSRGRRTIIGAYAVYPGSLNLIFLVGALQAGFFGSASDAAGDVLGVVQRQVAENPFAALLPILPLGVIAYGAANPPKANKARLEAAAADRAFLATRQKTRTEVAEATASQTPTPTRIE